MSKKILCIGEILWDSLPSGLFLGGAPFNVACHLNMLGHFPIVVSRVGVDVLGEIAVNRIKEKGILTDYIQVDIKIPTGLVNAKLDHNGNAAYEIAVPSAWDFIEEDEVIINTAKECEAIVFGSLAQRNTKTAKTIQSLLNLGKINIFDVNLRPPFENQEIIKQSFYKSSIVKLNEYEILKIANWFGLDNDIKKAAASIAWIYDCNMVCVTKGDKGAALLKDGDWFEHPGYHINIIDTVGAGDAFLAALINGYFNGLTGKSLLTEANALGAYVASKQGATPKIDFTEVDRIKKFKGNV